MSRRKAAVGRLIVWALFCLAFSSPVVVADSRFTTIRVPEWAVARIDWPVRRDSGRCFSRPPLLNDQEVTTSGAVMVDSQPQVAVPEARPQYL
jgi:hypothetical protein